MSDEQSKHPKEPYVRQADRPEIKADTPLGQLTARDLADILGQQSQKVVTLQYPPKPHRDMEHYLWLTLHSGAAGDPGLNEVIERLTGLEDKVNKLSEKVERKSSGQ
jgi:hypothetical protein